MKTASATLAATLILLAIAVPASAKPTGTPLSCREALVVAARIADRSVDARRALDVTKGEGRVVSWSTTDTRADRAELARLSVDCSKGR